MVVISLGKMEYVLSVLYNVKLVKININVILVLMGNIFKIMIVWIAL